MLTAWREMTKRDYPTRKYLLDMITSHCKPLISKIAKGGWIMSDTCNAAWKFQRLLIEAITEIANKEGTTNKKKRFLRQISSTTYYYIIYK